MNQVIHKAEVDPALVKALAGLFVGGTAGYALGPKRGRLARTILGAGVGAGAGYLTQDYLDRAYSRAAANSFLGKYGTMLGLGAYVGVPAAASKLKTLLSRKGAQTAFGLTPVPTAAAKAAAAKAATKIVPAATAATAATGAAKPAMMLFEKAPDIVPAATKTAEIVFPPTAKSVSVLTNFLKGLGLLGTAAALGPDKSYFDRIRTSTAQDVTAAKAR
jgi:hypothetical protein